jgi:hypothetical protein
VAELTDEEREAISWGIERDWQQRADGRDWTETYAAVERILTAREAEVHLSETLAAIERIRALIPPDQELIDEGYGVDARALCAALPKTVEPRRDSAQDGTGPMPFPGPPVDK